MILLPINLMQTIYKASISLFKPIGQGKSKKITPSWNNCFLKNFRILQCLKVIEFVAKKSKSSRFYKQGQTHCIFRYFIYFWITYAPRTGIKGSCYRGLKSSLLLIVPNFCFTTIQSLLFITGIIKWWNRIRNSLWTKRGNIHTLWY